MKLDKQQQAAVEAEDKNICLIAGAGSGKTRTLCARINKLIEKGVDPKKIYCITFTISAANTIKGRLDKEVGFVGTLHSLAYKYLKKELGEFMILPEQESENLIRKFIKQAKWKEPANSVMWKKKNWWKVSFDKNYKMRDKEALVRNLYNQEMNTQACYDYDYVLQLFAHIIQSEEVESIEHLLVDEFQDSAEIDLLIYDLLNVENNFYVGDPRQAIYGFRTGNKQSLYCPFFSYALSHDSKKNFTKLELSSNYRSTEAIVSTANIIQSSLTGMIAANEEMKAFNAEVKAYSFEDHYEQNHFIANFCQDDPENTAILCRTNNDAWEIREFLKERRISVSETSAIHYNDDYRLIEYIVNIYNNPNNKNALFMYYQSLHPNSSSAVIYDKIKQHVSVDTNQPVMCFVAQSGVSRDTCLALASRFPEAQDTYDGYEFLSAIKGENNYENTKGVHVGTIHSAKSREWENVIIAHCQDHKFPWQGEETKEERNVFYVACTRAKKNLIFVHSEQYYSNKYSFGVDSPKAIPSRFIHDLGLTS